jgi:hypothetical protein
MYVLASGGIAKARKALSITSAALLARKLPSILTFV